MHFSKSAITSTDDLPLVLTVSDVSKILGIGKNTAYYFIRSWAIKIVRVRRQILFPKSAFLEFL